MTDLSRVRHCREASNLTDLYSMVTDSGLGLLIKTRVEYEMNSFCARSLRDTKLSDTATNYKKPHVIIYYMYCSDYFLKQR